MNKGLFCYFGLPGDHNIDIPGHSFYIFPLLSRLKKEYNIDIFDFYSYLPYSIKQNYKWLPFNRYFEEERYNLIDDILLDIPKDFTQYNIIFLKARFRNSSTLTKKWYDTRKFEKIISILENRNIPFIIIDTDLSLPKYFYQEYEDRIITIDYLDKSFVESMVNDIRFDEEDEIITRFNNIVFYGNVYKDRTFKDPFLIQFFNEAPLNYPGVKFYILGKSEIKFRRIIHIHRTQRMQIYNIMKLNRIHVNITKNIYDEKHFIPARVFEAIMFYQIPVSYKFRWLFPDLSFNNMLEFDEIYRYIISLDEIQYFKLWNKCYLKLFKECKNV